MFHMHVPCMCVQMDGHIKQQQKAVKAEGRFEGKRELSTTLQDLLTADDYSSVFDISLLSNPWRAVEAYHFFLLVQKRFYSGNFEESLKTVRPYTTVLITCGVKPVLIIRPYFLLTMKISYHLWTSIPC